jgi:acyl-coenzyme A thioesterase PaaI-like protein
VGERLIARARVTKAGRTVTVCTCDVFALRDGQEKMVATMLNTLMTVRDRPELKG